MKLSEINESNIQSLKQIELLSIHKRIHQLYGVVKQRDKTPLRTKNIRHLFTLHTLLANEIKRRGIQHSSPILNYVGRQRI